MKCITFNSKIKFITKSAVKFHKNLPHFSLCPFFCYTTKSSV
ncbi:unknown [[Mannheimia] succiniciproducens MBEL55E]|uniref:Uncharacterized protein n=1 Tax=Mannheimia succiniciproducens (strain KCTC 0769BP / MBEL55E) TaxID=221988 RepID=Q65VL7_MANSM|nr:unknown [[Mannheimia] succiniciproducens MBEL55E]